jgi:branched-chain amino acid transport system substrate-binding protein
MRRAAAALVALAALAGCGASETPIVAGGRVVGDAVTVYASLPGPGEGASRDMLDAQKLAVRQAGGQAGGLDVNFVAVDEGDAGADSPPGVAAAAAEKVIRDPQVIAVIGALRSQTAATSIPLFNAAGILHVSPGAGYAGFTAPVAPGEPERWYPSGRETFFRLIGDDTEQAEALLAAAGGPRVRVEAEAGRFSDALVEALQEAARRDPSVRIVYRRPDAVIYAGTDVASATGVAEALAREEPGATLVFPDELTRASLADRLPPAVRRRAVMVSSAPEPGSTPELMRFQREFAAEFGRRPGPYAALGWIAMRRVLDALDGAEPRANIRRAVIDAYRDLPLAPAGFTAFRPLDDGPRYVR